MRSQARPVQDNTNAGVGRRRASLAQGLAAWGLAALALAACLPDNPVVDDDGTSDSETGGQIIDTGLLGCPSGDSCTIVAVSQTIDDRVELYTASGPGPSYRGALDVDLKPNPGGDINGENLDEPYGLAWDGATLHVLIGHYPSRSVGSLLSFPAVGLREIEAGTFVQRSEWFVGGAVVGLDATLRNLERTEPLSAIVLEPSGELLIAVFANDLLVPDAMWQTPSELLRLDPSDAQAQPTVIDAGCNGAWSVVALDELGERVALACDGDERVAMRDIGDESSACIGEIPFADKRVRYLAPDGLGGVIVGEQPPIVSANEDARLWWFDGSCQLRGFTTLDGDLSWKLRELELLDGAAPRWLLARADGDERGILILAGDPASGSISSCGRLDALDSAGAWTAVGGDQPLEPHALALSSDRRGLAIGVGPADYDSAGPGYGSVWWTTLDYADEACDAVALDVVELGDAAPAVDPTLPQTWRRAPDELIIIELGDQA